eukprot:CAMPEP_0116129174 /NCGR_PEP_ID=MMETSP0329-20121206/7788_1 /TAXON_ID=697910 /ORGANISM="Pseudo-nitzschia arenysensis, Strain B593" /LENGTH=519 /DNA_ID=CAMNT_0003623433 /DNA_START=127 /DNA_END=1684 /DNA_ORIENTATION=-
MAGQKDKIYNRREKAVEALIESIQSRFPQKGFTENTLGISQDETLQSALSNSPKKLLPLFEKLVKQFEIAALKIEYLENLVPLKSAWLSLRIMNSLSAKSRSRARGNETCETDVSQPVAAMDPLWLQSDTWPSEDEMRESFYGYWDEKKVKDIWGEKSSLTQDWHGRMLVLNQAFEELIYPLLKNEDCGGNDFVDTALSSNVEILKTSITSPSTEQLKEMVRNTFWYADAIIYTRSHEMPGDDEESAYRNRSPIANKGDCQIMPLVDLFNGDVSGATVKNSTSFNVNLARGKWPFLGGGNFRNDCNLFCSCVFAIRDIQAGEELILSYGEDLPVNHFLIKYGATPKSLLDPTMSRCNVRLWCDPSFIPKDKLRIACLRRSGFPLDDLANNPNAFLTEILAYGGEGWYDGTTPLDLYNQGHEFRDIGLMRHFLILAMLADEYELNRNFNTGKLRGSLYEDRVLQLLCKMIDYNLGLLQGPTNGTTSSDDVKAAKAIESTSPWEASALLARVAYRETLLAW